MASLWKRPESKFWFACFTGADGRRRKISTKTTDRRAALKIANEFEAAYQNHRTAAHVEKVIRRAHEEISGDKSFNVSLAEFAERWLKNKRAEGVKDSSMQFYLRSVNDFVAHLKDSRSLPVSRITRSNIESYRDFLAETRDLKTVGHRLSAIRMLFASAKRELGIESPAEFVRAGVKSRPLKKPAFTAESLRALLNHIDGEWRTFVLLGIYTGARLSDLQNLLWESVDIPGGMIHFTARKTGRVMRTPIAPPLARHLSTLAQGSAYILPGLASRRQGKISDLFATILRQCGLRDDKAGKARGTPALSFHSLRHALVSMIKEAGAPLSVAMEFAGHASKEMNQHYTTVGDDAMRKAAAALPDFVG